MPVTTDTVEDNNGCGEHHQFLISRSRVPKCRDSSTFEAKTQPWSGAWPEWLQAKDMEGDAQLFFFAAQPYR